ncbi:MAG: hypothetical protein KDE23_14840, partial [Caldilinea sp.]|nr:hypothetical protein [Caldilinea sp.]
NRNTLTRINQDKTKAILMCDYAQCMSRHLHRRKGTMTCNLRFAGSAQEEGRARTLSIEQLRQEEQQQQQQQQQQQ